MAAKYRYATEEYANHTIEKIRLVRTTIPGLGTLKKFSMKEMTEDPFHILTEMSVRNPLTGETSILMLEKNQTLTAAVNRSQGGLAKNATAGYNVAIPEHIKGLTVAQMRANTEKYYDEVLKKDLNKYSLSCSNCQHFGINSLRASGFDITPEIDAFADQKAGELVPKWARKPLNAITTAAAWVSNNITDKYVYKRPDARRINHTSLAQAGHHPRQQHLPSMSLPSTISNLNFPQQQQEEGGDEV